METPTRYDHIAGNIAFYRKRAGMTQRQLAERINCSPTYLSRVECGDRGVSIAMLIKISEALDVSCDALLKETGYDAGVQNICLLLSDCPEPFIAQVEEIVRIMKNISSVG